MFPAKRWELFLLLNCKSDAGLVPVKTRTKFQQGELLEAGDSVLGGGLFMVSCALGAGFRFYESRLHLTSPFLCSSIFLSICSAHAPRAKRSLSLTERDSSA